MAAKRTERWSPDDQEWLSKLPDSERDLVLLTAAHLNPLPEDDGGYELDNPKHSTYHDRYSELADSRD